MEVAQALSKEKFMHSSTSALLVNTGIDGSVTSGSENDEDAEKEASLLLDAAVTLCAIAAKKVIRDAFFCNTYSKSKFTHN